MRHKNKLNSRKVEVHTAIVHGLKVSQNCGIKYFTLMKEKKVNPEKK
jgi:hypothetical protein